MSAMISSAERSSSQLPINCSQAAFCRATAGSIIPAVGIASETPCSTTQSKIYRISPFKLRRFRRARSFKVESVRSGKSLTVKHIILVSLQSHFATALTLYQICYVKINDENGHYRSIALFRNQSSWQPIGLFFKVSICLKNKERGRQASSLFSARLTAPGLAF